MMIYRGCRVLWQQALKFRKSRLTYGAQRSELAQELLFPLWTDPGNAVQFRVTEPLAAQLTVIGDGEAMGLLLDISDKREYRLVRFDPDLLPGRGHECPCPVPVILYHAEYGDIEFQLLQHPHRNVCMGDASVDDVDFSIFVWGNKANNAPARLEAGTYIVRLMPNDQTDLSLALAEIEITIVEATADQLLSVNKTEFAVGEAINVTALGYCKDWVGIYLPGDEHSLYWEYVATVGAGKAFDITTESQKNDNVPEKLLAGNYVIRLMPNDTSDLSQALAEIEISIVNKYETETTPFVATDSNGDVIATSNEKGTWAWNLKFNKAGISGPISGELAYFRSGGIGGKVDFTVNVDNAGYYELDWAFRPHDASYCTVQFYVNGEKVGEPISQKNGDIIADEANKASVMRTVTVGGADFVAGENTITVELVAAKDDGDMTKTGFASDYFLLTPAVKPAEIVSGSNNEHKLGTEDGVDIVVSVAPEAVNQVKIGDTVLTKDTDYTVEATEEGAKISIKASALEALAAKKHTVTVATEAGEVTASVKVVNVAETGDATLALVLLAAALLTLSFCVVNKKRVSVR